MKLFDLYKEVDGQKIFLGRISAIVSDVVWHGNPILPEGERYLPAEECTDIEAYRAEIAELNSQIVATSDASRCFMLKTIVENLKETLDALEAK